MIKDGGRLLFTVATYGLVLSFLFEIFLFFTHDTVPTFYQERSDLDLNRMTYSQRRSRFKLPSSFENRVTSDYHEIKVIVNYIASFVIMISLQRLCIVH